MSAKGKDLTPKKNLLEDTDHQRFAGQDCQRHLRGSVESLSARRSGARTRPSLMKKFSFLLVALLGLLLSSKAQDGNPKKNAVKNPLEGQPEAIAVGQKLFLASCSGCHGTHAEGGRGPNLADGRIVRRTDDEHLFDAIHNGVPGANMPAFNLPDQQIWQFLAYIHSLSSPAAESHVPGDPASGEVTFFGKGACSSCHMLLGRGGMLGPDLSNIGMSRSWHQLNQALIDPKSRSQSGFQGVTVVTTKGTKITGIAKYSTNYSLVVQDADGNLYPLSVQDVRELISRKGSLMPDDYGQRLTPKEIDDVVAFLSRQSVRPIKTQSSTASPEKDFK
jgi:cytochrome c oxidase cbb3-type subunit III